MNIPDDLLTPADAARERGVTTEAIRSLIHRGRIKVYRVAGRPCVRRSDLHAMKPLKPGPKGPRKGKK